MSCAVYVTYDGFALNISNFALVFFKMAHNVNEVISCFIKIFP